jgi:predicted ATPase
MTLRQRFVAAFVFIVSVGGGCGEVSDASGFGQELGVIDGVVDVDAGTIDLSFVPHGGQALTAIALIFAVFLTNPSPICVLDEVDAPLDDANVERYCDLLNDMARSTQTRFIVITHNPITMARMDRLFGVTMAERGVSQLVSVDLDTAERFLEAS